MTAAIVCKFLPLAPFSAPGITQRGGICPKPAVVVDSDRGLDFAIPYNWSNIWTESHKSVISLIQVGKHFARIKVKDFHSCADLL